MPAVVSVGGRPYQWQENFLDYPTSHGWAHHDVAALADGRIITGHPDGRSLLVFRPDGRLLETVATPAVELHGITVVRSRAEERIWVADNGHKRTPSVPEYGDHRVPGRILELTLGGNVAQEIFQPPDAAYKESAWSPCDVAIDIRGQAAEGNVWVADGYGASLLHKYSPKGAILRTLDGGSTGQRFQTPYALLIDDRRAEPELYIADRGNRRIVVLSMAGEFRRSFGDDVLSSPSGLAIDGDLLLVTELDGALAVFDLDSYLGTVGRSPAERSIAWPNSLDERGVHHRPAHAEGMFNSPHGITTDLSGGVLVSEWSIGGRVVRLQPL
jgi:hypothetical protein